MNASNRARRNLLRFLAASPLVAAPSVASSIAAPLRLDARRGARPELRRAARRGAEARCRRGHQLARPGAERLRLRAGGEEGARRFSGALRLPRERRRRRRHAAREPRGVFRLRDSRAPPDRRAQGRHQRQDFRRDLGEPDLPLPGEQPGCLQFRRARAGRGARRGQARAPDDPFDRRQLDRRGVRQGARLADLVHAVPDRRLERDAGAREACRGGRRAGHRPHRRPAGRPQYRDAFPASLPGHPAVHGLPYARRVRERGGAEADVQRPRRLEE